MWWSDGHVRSILSQPPTTCATHAAWARPPDFRVPRVFHCSLRAGGITAIVKRIGVQRIHLLQNAREPAKRFSRFLIRMQIDRSSGKVVIADAHDLA